MIARVITPDGTWTGTSGGAGPDTDEPPTATDLARIGSVTKTMTGTILLQLVDEGLISLDDPVSQYVPDAPNGTATIQQVADMTSGIPSYSLYQGWQDQYFSDPATHYTRSRSWTSPRSCRCRSRPARDGSTRTRTM